MREQIKNKKSETLRLWKSLSCMPIQRRRCYEAHHQSEINDTEGLFFLINWITLPSSATPVVLLKRKTMGWIEAHEHASTASTDPHKCLLTVFLYTAHRKLWRNTKTDMPQLDQSLLQDGWRLSTAIYGRANKTKTVRAHTHMPC